MNRAILRLAWLGIAVLVVLAWSNSLHAPFVYDDKIEVIGNRTIRMLDRWRAIAGYNVSRPLLIFSYAWNYHLWGRDPFGYHVVDVVIHALAVGAALFMAEAAGRLGDHPRPVPAAVVAAALWAVHPMTTEAVTYVTGRSECLCALFCFLSLGAWARALRCDRAGQSGLGWRALGLFAFVFGIATKEVAAVVPAAALSLEMLVAARGGLGRRVRAVRWFGYLPFAMLLVAATWARLQHAGELLPKEVDRPLGVQLVTSAEVWLRYVGLWLLPVHQTIFHAQPEVRPASLNGVAAVAGWLALVAAGAWWGRRRPLVAWALLSGAIFLLPATSIVPLKESMAEHRAYQLGLWLALALAWTVLATGERVRRPVRVVVPLLLVLLVIATRLRNEVWSSEVALWAEATRRNPDVADAWYGLGDARRFAGKFTEAAQAYQKAIDLDPDHIDAWNNLGIARAELGDDDGARKAWLTVLRDHPTYCKAHNNLAKLALGQKRWEEALAEFQTALAYCPDSIAAHYGLANIYYGPRRDKQLAVAHYEAILKIAPDFKYADEVRKRLLELTW